MILIVDDRPENVFALKSTLQLHNFKIDVASSGEEALKKILNAHYSLIILDVQMPGMDGFEVAETISGFNKSKDTPIIFLSAVNTEKKFITKGYSSGAVDYITKPFDPDILLLKVKTLYKLSEQKRALQELGEELTKEVAIRKQIQEKAEHRLKELRTIMQSLPQVAFTLKTDGTVEFVNDEWFKYSSQANNLPEAHTEDEVVYSKWSESLHEGKEFTGEIRLKDLTEGNYKYFLMKILPVINDSSIIKWVGTFSDINEQKQANEVLEKKVIERTGELLKKNNELELINHELQQFAWVVSHDLKEPLRKIQTYNGLIKQKFLVEGKEGISLIERTISSAQRMSQLINDLLNYSRLSAESSFILTDLNELIDDVLLDFEHIIEEKKAKIKVDKLTSIEGIPSQLRQIFQNLISNSLKFSIENKEPEISISGKKVNSIDKGSKESPSGKYYRITVKDNGIGFDEKYVDTIFTIFQRLNGREAYEGTGIGLAIARKTMQLHKGSISASSNEGFGADFILTFPIHQKDH